MHTRPTPQPPKERPGPSPLQAMVVVGPDLDVLDALQCTDGGSYDQVRFSSRSQAYAQIKHWHPGLVVIYTGSDDVEGCQLLTLLTVDPDTRQIPVLILTAPEAPEDPEVESGRSSLLWLEHSPGLA